MMQKINWLNFQSVSGIKHISQLGYFYSKSYEGSNKLYAYNYLVYAIERDW